MSLIFIIFLVVFVLFLAVFAYLGTRKGFIQALMSFLRVAVPMVLSAIIVQISNLISKSHVVSYIVFGIGAVIFYIVLRDIIKVKKTEKDKSLSILDFFLGFLFGAAIGWLLAGLILEYLTNLSFISILKKPEIQNIINSSLCQAIVKPIHGLIFFQFK